MKQSLQGFDEQMEQSLKIRLNKDDTEQLKQDCKTFGFSRMNEFLNTVFINYIGEYNEELERTALALEKGMSEYKTESNRRNFEISLRKTALGIYTHSGTYSKDLIAGFSVVIWKRSKDTIAEALYRIDPDKQLSVYLRGLLLSYLSLPEYRRELIAYRDLVEKIKPLLKKRKIIYRTPGKGEKLFNPYSIEHSDHELRNYLIGESNNSHHIVSIRLANLGKVFKTDEKAEFREDFEDYYQVMKKNGFQFAVNEISEKTIILNKEQYNTFKNRFIDRPAPISEEEKDGTHILTFNCSKDQLDFYFHPFDSKETDKTAK